MFSMESKLFLSSPRSSLSIVSAPLLLSHKSYLLEKPKLSSKPHVSLSLKEPGKSSFLGNSLVIQKKSVPPLGYEGNTQKRFAPIRAAVKRRKEASLDNVIQRDKKLKLVMKLRKILVNQPNRIMAIRDLGRYRKALGLQRKRRFIALLRKFPAVFEIEEEGAYSLNFKLTPEAERLYMEELKIRNDMEDMLVVKLRKLLMMSEGKRILIEKIAHLKHDLGLPLEFRDTICRRYPQYFKVVATGRGPALELTHWDPELAVSAAELAEEENKIKELEEKNLIIDRPLKFNKVKLPKGLNLSKGEMRRIGQFRDMPYISPYSDFSEIRSGTLEKEKHAVGVVHEILSLTIEKKTLVDHLTHFRDEFRFSQQLRGMLIRHPDLFYVSLKGDRDSVFLRDGYRDSHLIEKDRLLLVKEKLRSLVVVPRFPKRGGSKTGEDGESEEGSDDDDDEEEWSEIEDEMGDGIADGDDKEDGEDYEDDWSEDDELPPDFDDDGENADLFDNKSSKVDRVAEKEEKVLAFPDGRTRERW